MSATAPQGEAAAEAASRTMARRTGRLALRIAAWVVGAAAAAWVVGFLFFVDHVLTEKPPAAMPHADGIVVLTGGADRIRAGLSLLGGRIAPRLLISGAGPGTNLADFVPQDSPQARQLDPAITLGHVAMTTRGNARESAVWAAQHHARSLIVVTADYHMPRAMLELRRHLPWVRLIADPVRPPAMARLWAPRTLRLLAGEFDKYLLVRLGLGGFAAHHIEKYL